MSRIKVSKNIYKDTDRNCYYVNLYFGVNPDTGKPIKRSKTYKTKADAIGFKDT